MSRGGRKSERRVVQKVPPHARKTVKRLVHDASPTAVGYFVDNASEQRPVLLAGRSPLSYLIFRRLIDLPSISRLDRNVALLWIDVIDELEDQRRFEEILGAEKGFHDAMFFIFYPSELMKPSSVQRKAQRAYVSSLKFLASKAGHRSIGRHLAHQR